MAESSKSAADNLKSSDAPNHPEPSRDRGPTPEQVRAIIRAARENPGVTNISWPTPTDGVSPAEAMDALLEMEEEALQEELQDPETTEVERATIRQRLSGMQTQRRWLGFTRMIGSPSTNLQNAPRSDDDKPSKTGKEPSR
ncbi:hypothetical protein VTI74DRAFT_2478 [Chaetomium olivicolor]